MADAGIIRSNGKIDAAISGARIYCDMRDRGEDLGDLLWGMVGGKPVQSAWTLETGVPAQTPLAVDMSKMLKAKGYKYCGPVIVYAFMQATGLVNDHLTTCFRHEACRKMAR
jgi:DNA-3-methyladenine glycosylase I